jgi:hypothetical protein
LRPSAADPQTPRSRERYGRRPLTQSVGTFDTPGSPKDTPIAAGEPTDTPQPPVRPCHGRETTRRRTYSAVPRCWHRCC